LSRHSHAEPCQPKPKIHMPTPPPANHTAMSTTRPPYPTTKPCWSAPAPNARFLLALKLFEQGRISSGKAGRLCHRGRVEFLLAASRAGVPVGGLKEEELAQEFN